MIKSTVKPNLVYRKRDGWKRLGATQNYYRGFGTHDEVPIQVGVITRQVCSFVCRMKMEWDPRSTGTVQLRFFGAHPNPANVAHLTMHMYKYACLTNTPTQCIHRHSCTDFCLVNNKTFPAQMKMGLDVHYSGFTIILTFTSLQTELSIHNVLCCVVESQLKLSRSLTFSFYSKCTIVPLVMLILIQSNHCG